MSKNQFLPFELTEMLKNILTTSCHMWCVWNTSGIQRKCLLDGWRVCLLFPSQPSAPPLPLLLWQRFCFLQLSTDIRPCFMLLVILYPPPGVSLFLFSSQMPMFDGRLVGNQYAKDTEKSTPRRKAVKALDPRNQCKKKIPRSVLSKVQELLTGLVR